MSDQRKKSEVKSVYFSEEKDDKTAQGLIMELVHMYFLKIYNQMEGYGLHPGQVAAMKELQKKEGMSQRELADALHIKPPTVAVSIKRMEKGGFVERRPDEKDQRIIRIYLTEYGKKVNDEISELLKENEKVLFKEFEEGEIYLFKRFLKQMIGNIRSTIPKNIKEPKLDFHDVCEHDGKR